MSSHSFLLLAIPFVVAFVSVCWIHPWLVRMALLKNLVDNPDSRKLQRNPVPVLGGIAVFFGVFLGLGVLSPWFDCTRLFLSFTLMTLMLYVGTLDDIMGLSPRFRFLVEILGVLLLVFIGHHSISDFHGLWGLYDIPLWVSAPLTVFAAVGIINAINLIDGVNGLSSGYCVMSCFIFGCYFYHTGDLTMTVFAAVCAGALIPFFLHNVFGNTSRMFIGDGGTLLMGMVMSIFVTHVLDGSSYSPVHVARGMGLIPFTLSVLSIPVFDTLRVMSCRIAKGRSPFMPDKTHLHHLFIEVGFSHAGTTFCILTLNSLVVLAWWGMYAAGVSVDMQLYAVILLGVAFTFGLYSGVKSLPRKGSVYRFLRRCAVLSHIERKGIYLWMQRMVDKN